MLKKVSLSIAVVALASAPVFAQGAIGPSLAPLSGDESELSEGSTIILGLIGAAAIIGGIIAASSSNDPQIPVSG